ncbi:hypothetical protein PWT90_00686 [Aphanocladium album]|nr:hypothetical protein PWT90_00686 [Aphanocladium album]
MAPSVSKANYKSYDAQARLVRAIVAAHPAVKWNYKEIAACYGSDMTDNALNHRFRLIRAQSEIITVARGANLDMKYLSVDESALPKTVGAIDKNSTQSKTFIRPKAVAKPPFKKNLRSVLFKAQRLTELFIDIAKYFGQSTADGIQFQFRTIKKDADKMRATADGGGDPSTCLDLGSGSGPSFTPTTPPKTQRSRNTLTTPTTGGGGSAKRSRAGQSVVKIESDEEGEDSESTHNWSEMEATPSKRPRKFDASATPGQKNGAPSRLAAARASATIASASAQLQSSESEAETRTASSMTPRPAAGGTPAHLRNGTGSSGLKPSSSFATTAPQVQQPQAQRSSASLFGSVPAHAAYSQPARQPSPPSSSLFGSDAFRNTGADAYFGGGGSSSQDFGHIGHGNTFYDDDDTIDGEI